MATMTDKYDNAFLSILQNEGQIANFMDALFSFLYRRTDFYHIMTGKEDRMGFPPGVAMKLVKGAFQKYEKLARERTEHLRKAKEREKELELKGSQVPQVVREEVVNNDEDKSKPAASSTSPTPHKTSPAKDESSSDSTPMEAETAAPAASSNAAAANSEAVQPAKPSSNKKPVKNKKDGNDSEDDDSELSRMQKVYQANPESYNGAIRDNYTWSQSITDVDIRIDVPKYVKKGKDVQVLIEKKHIRVAHRDESGAMTTIVDSNLTWEVHREEAIWSLVPGEHVHINLEKLQERWWEAAFEDEPKINVRKIDPSRPVTDLDDEAQAKIEEMMYNEEQKRLGKPQSHEMKVHDMLRNAWDMEGSPFKGQPFDPSQLHISADGTFPSVPPQSSQ